MPLKDLDARREYAHKRYLNNKSVYIEQSKKRRLRLQAKKAEMPKIASVPQSCIKCNAARDTTAFPIRGNTCKQCVSVYNTTYRAKHKEHISEQKKAWKNDNKEHVKSNDIKYAQENPEIKRVARAKWNKNNMHVKNALGAGRRTAKLNRTPVWVDSEELWLIKEVYALATLRTKLTNIKWSVDHIIPLQGKLVSGLHTIANLQVIPAVMNSAKNNRFEVL